MKGSNENEEIIDSWRGFCRYCILTGVVSLIGGYDPWRISAGVRMPNEFLYVPPSGTIIIFR